MRVYDDGAGRVEYIAKDEVCRLASHAGQGEQLVHAVGHPAAVLCEQHLRAGHDVARLRVEETAGAYVALDLGDVGLGKGFEGRIALKERGRYHVHSLVRTLGGEADGKQQLVVLAPVQGAVSERIFSFKARDYLGGLFGSSDNITAFDVFHQFSRF